MAVSGTTPAAIAAAAHSGLYSAATAAEIRYMAATPPNAQ
jgi:hypothetical protein